MFELLFKYERNDFARSELVFLSEWSNLVIYGLALVAVVAIIAGLYKRCATATYPRILVIGLLQMAMVAVVIVMLMQPTLTTDKLRDGENAVALVLDNSSSMAHGTAESRFAAARRNLAASVQADAAPNLALRHYELGGRAVPVDSFVATTPTGSATSIAESLLAILDEARFSPLAAVVLSSDGADTSGGLSTDELAQLASFGVPIHTIGVGRSEMPEDLELADVTVPDTALPGSTVSARVTVKHDAAATTRVKVYDGDELLQLVPVELTDGASSSTVWVDVEMTEAGPHQLTFSIDGDTTEPELKNNNRSTLIDVADQRYRVLYYEGEPRWEYKFLRRAIDGDDDLSIATLLRVSPNKFYRQGIESAEQLQSGFPTTRDDLFTYDALIIGSVEAASLSTEQQELIRDFVSDRGGSLLMIAGPSGLGNGGWGQSEVADVLPAQLPATTVDSFHRKKAAVLLTAQGADSQMLRFATAAEENRAAWRALPEIADYQLTGSLKPAAVTLINVATESGEVPLLISQPFGRGHAYILATGGTWRWQMSLPVEDQKHETFWRQLLRGLVVSSPKNVSLVASGNALDSSIELRAEFRDDAFQPVDDIGVTVVASHENGETFSVPMQPGKDDAGVFTGQMSPPLSGTWYFEALAERNGEAVAVSRASILHAAGQAEHFGFRRNSGLLQRLSEVTGGRYFGTDDLSALPDLLRYSSSGITETEYRAFWDAPAFFALLLLLKAGEWLLRRRWSSI